jgi:hypothetical protein
MIFISGDVCLLEDPSVQHGNRRAATAVRPPTNRQERVHLCVAALARARGPQRGCHRGLFHRGEACPPQSTHAGRRCELARAGFYQVQEQGDLTLVMQRDEPMADLEAGTGTALSDNQQSPRPAPPEPESPKAEREWAAKYNAAGEVYDESRRQCSITHLRPGAVYKVRICARNRAGLSTPHELATSLVMQPSVPDAPAAPVLLNCYSLALEIGWAQPCVHGEAIVAYRLEMLPEGFTGEFREVYSGTELRFKVFNLKPARRYHFRVTAVNACGASPASGISEMATNPIAQPPPAKAQPPKTSSKGRGGSKSAPEEVKPVAQRGGKGRGGSKKGGRGEAHEVAGAVPAEEMRRGTDPGRGGSKRAPEEVRRGADATEGTVQPAPVAQRGGKSRGGSKKGGRGEAHEAVTSGTLPVQHSFQDPAIVMTGHVFQVPFGMRGT